MDTPIPLSKLHCQGPEKYEKHRQDTPPAISSSIWLFFFISFNYNYTEYNQQWNVLLGSQWDSKKPPGFYPKYLKLCSEDERSFYGFGTTWG